MHGNDIKLKNAVRKGLKSLICFSDFAEDVSHCRGHPVNRYLESSLILNGADNQSMLQRRSQ